MWKAIFIIFLLVRSDAMPARYDKFKFSDFRGGESPTALVSVENKYYTSENIKVNNESGKLALADGLASQLVSNTQEEIQNTSQAVSSSRLFVALVNSSFDHLIYASDDGETWTLKKTILTADWADVQSAYIITNGPHALLIGDQLTTNWVSHDNGDSWSEISAATEIPDGFRVSESGTHKDGYFYSLGDGSLLDFAIVRSADLETWEIVKEYSETAYEEGFLFEFQGFIHFMAGYNVLLRLVNNNFEEVKNFSAEGAAAALKISENRAQIYTYNWHTGEQLLYHWDGSDFTLINRTSNFTLGSGFSDGANGWYIGTSGSDKYLVKWDENGNIFKTSELSATAIQEKLYGLKNTAYHIYIDSSSDKWRCDRLNNYKDSGTLETKTIETEELIPKQLILRHAPLESGETVKLYYKKNQESSYSSALITSNTVGAVKKKYTFPNGTAVIDFAQLKFELSTSDATKTPHEVDAVLLGVKVGLENAK